MSEIRVDKLKGEDGSSTVELTTGATIPSGKTVVGAGADFTIRNLTGVAATFSGQVTYEDILISIRLVLSRKRRIKCCRWTWSNHHWRYYILQ